MTNLKRIRVQASYDGDANVWYVEHSDLFGVHAEGDTLDELRAKLPDIVHDMIEAGGGDLTGEVVIDVIPHASTRPS